MDYSQLLILGAIAGFAIFLGLSLAVMKNLNATKKVFLNAMAIGLFIGVSAGFVTDLVVTLGGA